MIYKVAKEESGRVYSEHWTLRAAKKSQETLFAKGIFGYKIFKLLNIPVNKTTVNIWIRI